MNRTVAAILGIILVGGLVWWLVGRNDGDMANNVNGEENVACTMDAKLCPDGSYVGRDPQNSCEFRACPGEGGAEEDEPVFDKG